MSERERVLGNVVARLRNLVEPYGDYDIESPPNSVRGPAGAILNVIEAAAILQSLPRPLVWSSEPPKVPGWYWVKFRKGERPELGETPELVKVRYPCWYEKLADRYFAGPIPEPVEPEGGE